MFATKRFTLEDPTNFKVNQQILNKINEARSKILDYDDSRYDVLRTELEELFDLFKEFEHALSVHDLMMCEIYRDKILIDHVMKNADLIKSIITKVKDEFKSTINDLCLDVLSKLDQSDVEIAITVDSFISTINFNFEKFEKDFDYLNFTLLKHNLKNWISIEQKHFSESLKQSLIDLWIKFHYFEGVYMNLVSFMTAIMLFYDLIEVVY